MREILNGIYSITLYNDTDKQGVTEINVYIIKGKTRSLMIDTGFNRENCLNELEKGLKTLNIDYGFLDIFLTHRHFDHCSLARLMAEKGATIYMNSS